MCTRRRDFWGISHFSVTMPLTEKLEMLAVLARLRAGQCDGRRRQADDDFGGWVKTTVIF